MKRVFIAAAVVLLFGSMLLVGGWKKISFVDQGSWALGIDAPFAYANKFDIPADNMKVTVEGRQFGVYWKAVRYSVVKKDTDVARKTYASFDVAGDGKVGQKFVRTFDNLPSGERYELKVSAVLCMCRGSIKVTVHE